LCYVHRVFVCLLQVTQLKIVLTVMAVAAATCILGMREVGVVMDASSVVSKAILHAIAPLVMAEMSEVAACATAVACQVTLLVIARTAAAAGLVHQVFATTVASQAILHATALWTALEVVVGVAQLATTVVSLDTLHGNALTVAVTQWWLSATAATSALVSTAVLQITLHESVLKLAAVSAFVMFAMSLATSLATAQTRVLPMAWTPQRTHAIAATAGTLGTSHVLAPALVELILATVDSVGRSATSHVIAPRLVPWQTCATAETVAKLATLHVTARTLLVGEVLQQAGRGAIFVAAKDILRAIVPTKVQRTLVGTWSAVPAEEEVTLPRCDFTKTFYKLKHVALQ
jgi:hypothetical protein